MGAHPRRFAPVRPTGRNSDAAKLILSPKAPIIDCGFIDYSTGSACLEIWGQTKPPDRFELLFGGAKKRCRIAFADGRVADVETQPRVSLQRTRFKFAIPSASKVDRFDGRGGPFR